MTAKITIEIEPARLQLILCAAMAGLASEEGTTVWNNPGGLELVELFLSTGELDGVLDLTSTDAIETLTQLTKELL